MKRAAICVATLTAGASPALAHSSSRGFVLLLPTQYVIISGSLAVLATFAFLLLRPARAACAKQDSGTERPFSPAASPYSLLSAAILAFLIYCGFAGPPDPAENLLPLVIWTVWWMVIVLLHPVFGNIWRFINPFTGICAFAGLNGGRLGTLPTRLAYWPALLIFAAFAWFQLVDPAPEDPRRLAVIVSAYALITLAAVFLFGAGDWLGKGDPFAIFFGQLAAVAPYARGKLRPPGRGLIELAPLPVAGTLFVLLTLSSISFDGFSQTFTWLSALGVNPLDYPGRTALMAANTFGLAGAFGALAVIYAGCIWLGWLWSGNRSHFASVLGRFVLSIIPISVAYHFAHYVSDALLNLQYLVLALNDPLGLGADLLGLAGWHPTASFQNTAHGALVIFALQSAAIVAGHLVAVAVAHEMASDESGNRTAAAKLETPLSVFMVLYTGFGLWLLATPAIS
jgi:hypothetical protein